MGQSVVALMYGVSGKTKGLFNSEGEPFWDDNDTAGMHLDWDDAPRQSDEGDVIGYPVACSAPDDDEGDLSESCLAVNLEKQHAKFIKAARKKWDKFAAWALREHGKTLPPASLWFTKDERA